MHTRILPKKPAPSASLICPRSDCENPHFALRNPPIRFNCVYF